MQTPGLEVGTSRAAPPWEPPREAATSTPRGFDVLVRLLDTKQGVRGKHFEIADKDFTITAPPFVPEVAMTSEPHLVPASQVAIQASRLVFLVCLFSLSTSLISGVHMIHPLISIIVGIGCVPFYVIGRMLKKQTSGV